jgi:hypothetical protein
VPIDVLWEEKDWEDGTPGPAPTRVLEVVRDDHSLVERFLSGLNGADFPYLHFISLETVTVFHQPHIAQLITELEALCARDHDPHVAKHLRAVLQLVSAAYGPQDTLIAFRVRAQKEQYAA